MRNGKTNSSSTFKKKIPKCTTIFFAYSNLQQRYGEILSTRDEVIEFKANVKLEGFSLGDQQSKSHQNGIQFFHLGKKAK